MVRREEKKVKDLEKTETENERLKAENVVNRKLDALKVAVIKIAAIGRAPSGIVLDLYQAWKEEEEDD